MGSMECPIPHIGHTRTSFWTPLSLPAVAGDTLPAVAGDTLPAVAGDTRHAFWTHLQLILDTCPASRIRGRHPFCIAVFITFLSRSRGTSKAAPPFWTHLHLILDSPRHILDMVFMGHMGPLGPMGIMKFSRPHRTA